MRVKEINCNVNIYNTFKMRKIKYEEWNLFSKMYHIYSKIVKEKRVTICLLLYNNFTLRNRSESTHVLPMCNISKTHNSCLVYLSLS